MAAKKTERLLLVLELAERQVDDATEVFQLAQSQLDAESQKLDSLNEYYTEYSVTFEASGMATTGEAIARQRYFLAQLAEAITSQKHMIARCETVVQDKQALWHKAYLKHRSLEDLIQRIKDDETKMLNLKEEKMLDEWAQQASQRPSIYS